jgi:adenine deaminase
MLGPDGRGDVATLRRLAVARGDEPADLVLRGGQVFSVFTREWLRHDVAICEGQVVGLGEYRGRRELDLGGAPLVPGLIDAHVHLESSMLTPDQFARAVVPHGTTAVVADPHELANVLGPDGVHWFLDVLEGLPLDVFVMAPSCVPASPFESPRQELGVGALAGLLRRRRVIGVAEMMNVAAVVRGDRRELAKLATGLTDHVDGHAPQLSGRELNAYLAAGIRSDHESTRCEEALEKRRLGMAVMLREASGARNLRDLLPLIGRGGPEGLMFCTDDRDPIFLAEEGHLDQMLRTAVAEGVSAEDALIMASWNVARFHRLPGLGAIAPGYWADLVVLEDLESFRPRLVLKRGAEPTHRAVAMPEWVRNTVHLPALEEDSFRFPPGGRVRAIRLIPGQLLTAAEVLEATCEQGRPVADPDRDLAQVAVVERHHGSGRIGLGFVRGFGLRRGAFASTVAHDAHNLVLVGVSPADLVACAECLAACGGGIAVAAGGKAEALPLPVAGLMSDRPLEEVVARLHRLEARVRDLGVGVPAPFMTLSFLALSVIPELKITDRGLVDVARFELVPAVL